MTPGQKYRQRGAALLLLLACMVLLLKALHADMVNTRIERDMRRLNQRLAMFEADLEALGNTTSDTSKS